MLPPAALVAFSLFANVVQGANPFVAASNEWALNPTTVAAIAAPSASQPARASVGDYVAQSPAHLASFILPPLSSAGADTVALSSDEAALLADLNDDRMARGLAPLALDPNLVAVARSHSEDMCHRNYFDHMAPGPGPVSPMDRYLASLGSRPDYAMVGENIYYRSATDGMQQSATEANDAFMNSPGHRANILQPLYTKVGIGIYRDPQTGEFWVTQMFLRDTQ